jgi:hypothetical protein
MTQTVTINTTVDITPTGVRRKSDDPDWLLKRNQQRNYDTLMQVLGLRCQPLDVEIQVMQELLEFNFEKVWIIKFKVERDDVLGKEGELFLDDVEGVPIVPALTETTPSFPPQFITRGPLKNIGILVVASH